MKLRILHVEDSVDDSEIVRRILRGDGIECEIERRETRAEFIETLRTRNHDLILADCSLPGFSGLQALALAHEYSPETPFIFVSGTIGEEPKPQTPNPRPPRPPRPPKLPKNI